MIGSISIGKLLDLVCRHFQISSSLDLGRTERGAIVSVAGQEGNNCRARREKKGPLQGGKEGKRGEREYLSGNTIVEKEGELQVNAKRMKECEAMQRRSAKITRHRRMSTVVLQAGLHWMDGSTGGVSCILANISIIH